MSTARLVARNRAMRLNMADTVAIGGDRGPVYSGDQS
jgi:hypothetical protein